VDMFF